MSVRLVASGGHCAICDKPALNVAHGSNAYLVRSDSSGAPGAVTSLSFAGLAYFVDPRACYGVYRAHFGQQDESAGWRIGTFCAECLFAARDVALEHHATVIEHSYDTPSFDRILELMLNELRERSRLLAGPQRQVG